ncbi:molybdopterin-binding protein [Kribbella sp. NPDC003557]|uniref:molybdopterin molybdotransferase MoeA n=1 Tax=Kribbella sp. NPDC003557 TaxID=3154449 RepID=UPI0033B7BBD7
MPWDVARQLAHAAARPGAVVTRPLAEADGCVLATPLVSPVAVPPVDRAAMDGYAVRGAGPWRVIGHVHAGCADAGTLEDGQATSIVTGAAVPTGTTSVIRSEDAVFTSALPQSPSEDTVTTGGVQESPSEDAGVRAGLPEDPPEDAVVTGGMQESSSEDTVNTGGLLESPSEDAGVRGGLPEEPSEDAVVTGGVLESPSADAGVRAGFVEGLSADAVLTGGVQESPSEGAGVTRGLLEGPSEEGRHIRRAGEECKPGDQLLPAGVVVGPAVLGLAATVGLNRLTVIPPPTVAALITGDELIHQGPSSPGRVRDAIGPMLPGLITRAGAIPATAPTAAPAAASGTAPNPASGAAPSPTTGTEPGTGSGAAPGGASGVAPGAARGTAPGAPGGTAASTAPGITPGAAAGTAAGTAPGAAASAAVGTAPGAAAGATPGTAGVRYVADSLEQLVDALRGTRADLILVSGSSAAGPADHLRVALDVLGAELIVDGVACRPGHPQALAQLPDGRLVLGLPGNPFAALVAFLTLGVAAINRLRGLPLPELPQIAVPGGIACHPTSTRLVPIRLTPQGAVPVGHGGAAMLRGPAAADALAVVAPGPAEAIAARLLPLNPGPHPWPA